MFVVENNQLQLQKKACPTGYQARVPGSKSLTNRAIIAAILCEKEVVLEGVLESEDTQLAKDAAIEMGASIETSGTTWTVRPNMFPKPSDKPFSLYMGNSGTTVRFMSAVICALGLETEIDGSERMRERPLDLLIDAVNKLGGQIESVKGTGCPPLKTAKKAIQGGEVELSGQVSSQYFSGLMMACPIAKENSIIRVSDVWLSLPYIEMTQQMLECFGIKMTLKEKSIEICGGQKYKSPGVYQIEPDASAATYPLGLGALHNVPVTIPGLGSQSLQGDVRFAEVLGMMGCDIQIDKHEIQLKSSGKLKAIQTDLNDIPDAAMTVVVLCCLAEGTSRLTGLKNLAFKECDRLKALETECNKMGAKVKADSDGFTIEGVSRNELKAATIETYKDHRIAMCCSLLGTLVDGVKIIDPRCVEKTYPNFFEDLHAWLGLE